MKRGLQRGRFLTGVAAASSTVAFSPSVGRAADFQWKHSHGLPVDFAANIRTVQLWDEVRRLSNGRLNVTVYPNNQLGSETGTFEQLRVGAIQVLTDNSAVYASLVAAAAVDNVGFAFKSATDALAAMDGPLGTYVRSEFAAKGIYAFEKIFDLGFRRIESATHPIVTVGDLTGFKIRTVPARISVDLFRTLGASPTPLGGEEMYTGLQTHLIDGLDVTLPGYEKLRMYEVSKYVSMTNHVWAGAWMVANGDAMKSLPADLRDLVVRTASKYTLLARQDASKDDASVIDKLKSQGIVFNTPDTAPFRARLVPYYLRWRPEIGTRAWGLLESKVGPLG